MKREKASIFILISFLCGECGKRMQYILGKVWKILTFISIVPLISGMLCGCGNQGEITENSALPGSVSQPVLNENGKEEICLSAISLDVTMQEIVSDYNRQNDRYEVVFAGFDRETTVDVWRARLQLELTNGGGPDILAATALQNIDMRPYAETGVLLDVTDFLAGQGEFVKNVAEANQVGDRIYGVPYSFSLYTMVTSPRMATNRENWTAEYCMRTAQDVGINTFISAPYGWTSDQSGLYVLKILSGGGERSPFVCG